VSKRSKWLETYTIIEGQISKPKMRECWIDLCRCWLYKNC
jgi:hypothetical protein